MCHVGKMFIREYVLSGNRCRAKGMSGKRLSGNRGVTSKLSGHVSSWKNLYI
ncbi:hypothetical protein RirG_067690 [Rhizophagus irregularis DAOM 197198w]|uniref:Uncharacterized protein n=1 Tax=Rhizophagus irregularis (strain DAOM 197198w) TaxID=1432141 RepID=A0A015LIV4_RHIIW|nr:hypothetical protein RirG_067690 [Rhizophagus irregularis DAOM 197198w]